MSLEDQMDAITGAATAIASAYRPIHNRHTSDLLQDAQHHLPADKDKASCRRQPIISAISALDATLLSEEAVPASQLTYRLGNDSQLDYGEYATQDYSSGHHLINVD